MAEKNTNGEITAKNLLSRLGVKKDAEARTELNSSESAFENEELVAPDESFFDEPAEAYEPKPYANTESGAEEAVDFDAGFVDEEAFGELFSELDSIGSAIDNGYLEELPDEYSAYSDEVEGSSGTLEEAHLEGIDAIDVLEIAETFDDFDNDPLEAEDAGSVEELLEKLIPEEEAEYDEAADFENLVSEVVGEGSIDDIGESDISLMVALGMEDELARNIGEEDATIITDDYLADQEEWVDKTENYGPDEYTDMSQNRDIAVGYTNKNKWCLVRLIASLLLTIGLLFYENIPVLGYQVSGFADPAVYPVVYLMMSLQMLFFLIALNFNSMVDGIKSIIVLKPNSNSVAAVAAAAGVINTIHSVFTIVPGVEPKVFNLPVALCLLLCVVCEFYTNRREIFSFNIVSSKTPKYVMRRLNIKDSRLENEAVADLDEESTGDIVKIAKTDFVEGYFFRTKKQGTVDKPFVSLILIVSAVLSLIVGLYILITQRNGSAVETALKSLITILPVSTVMVGFYPFYRANKDAYYNDCTIIGEGAVEEYSDTEVISFDDVNVFPSVNVKVKNVRLYNNCRIDKVLYYAASVFGATGGPLSDVFEVATMEMGHSEDVQIVECGNGFVEARVNGKDILFAKEEALIEKGITITESVLASDPADEMSPDSSIMYMIYQKRLVSKMILSYIIDADFEYIIRQLSESGMYVCVKTFDPNIDETLINRQVTVDNYPLRVIKYKGTEEITKYSERAEGGIVSRGTTKALLQTISSCDRIIGAKKTGYVLSVVAAIVSVFLVCYAVISGKYNDFYSLYSAAAQAFWLIPAYISAAAIVK